MASGVNVKMGVSGVAQFKQGMKESQNAVKTLDAALKLNEAQFKATGDAQAYMEGKSDLLKKQIEEQNKVVEQAQRALDAMQKNGVSPTSDAFQKMQQQMLKAQGDLVNMQTELENVGESGGEAQQGVSDMNGALKRIGDGVSYQNVTDGLGKITDSLEKAAQSAINLGKKLIQSMLSGGQWADELQTAADQWEIKPEQLYRMRQTANMIDTDADVILSAQQRLERGLGKKDASVMGAFAALIGEGYDPTGKNITDVMWDAGEALMAYGDTAEKQQEREAYASTLFGKSWKELIPLFKAGREEYDETMDSWTWIGDKQFESLKKVDDASQKMNSEWEALKLQFEATMGEVFTPVMETLTGLMKEFNTYLQSDEGQQMLQKLGDAVASLFSDLTEIDPDKVMESIVGLFEKITVALQWIIDNKDTVKTALEAVAAAFAAIKIGNLALNIEKIVSGLGNLGILGGNGGAGAAAGAGGAGAGAGAGAAGAGGAGGFFSSLGSAAKTALPYIGSTAMFLAPAALFVDGMIRDEQTLSEMMEKGQAEIEQYEKDIKKYAGAGLYDTWKVMEDYTSIGGAGAGADTAAMTEFARNWMAYRQDPWAEDEQLDRLFNLLFDSNNLEDFDESMDDLVNGRAHYSQEEMDNFYSPIHRALALIEGDMEEESKKNNVTSEDIQTLNEIPAKVETAVKNGMAGVTIIINEGAVRTIGDRIRRDTGDMVYAYVK